jgi:hypothetical protein
MNPFPNYSKRDLLREKADEKGYAYFSVHNRAATILKA